MRQGNRVIGAGKIDFKRKGATEWTEIGEVQGASISVSVDKAETYDKSSTIQKIVAMAAVGVSASIKINTRRLNTHNLALYMLGKEDTVTYEIGDTLPDGSIAAEQTVVPRIQAGTDPLIEGSVRFRGDDEGDEMPVTVCEDVVLTPSGDRSLMGDKDYTQIDFDGAILANADGVLYEEYLMPVA